MERVTPGQGARLPGLDFWRAVAIVVTMLFHKGIDTAEAPALGQIARFGWMGVDLFFVLSGYLIAGQLFRSWREDGGFSLRGFYMRRAWRILPAYLVVLALYVTVPSVREAPHIRPLWEFLTFTENFRIDYTTTRAFSHVWSLCVEEHFYLVLPLLVLWLRRSPGPRKAVALVLGVLLVGMVLRGWIWTQGLAPLRSLDEEAFAIRYIETIYYPTTTRLDGLLVGVVLAAIQVFRPGWWAWAMGQGWRLFLVGLLLVGGAIGLFQDRFSLPGAVLGFPLLSLGLGLLVASGLSEAFGLSRIRIPGADILATLAYSLYLTHKAVFHLNETWLGPLLERGTVWAFGIHAAVCLAVAMLLHVTVERPFLRLRKG